MVARGWINERITDIREQAEHVLRSYFGRVGPATAVVALYRQTWNIRSAREMDRYALAAWTARVAIRAKEESLPTVPYTPGSVGIEFMRELARLSVFENGPVLAKEI